METFSFKGKAYSVDSNNFLVDFEQWDEDFATGMAPKVSISTGLSDKHWDVIRYIRDSFRLTGDCPLVYQACRVNGLLSKDLKKLFPTGYLRGACLLSGITYKDRFVNYYGEPGPEPSREARTAREEKVYRVNALCFLIDPSEWDENFAVNRAYDMKIPGGLTDKHWKIIHFLRDSFRKNHTLPTLYECCEANQIELDGLERLFPDGYHRGAVRIAGLRVL